MAKVLDCSLQVSEFKFQLHYNIHFRTETLGRGMCLFNPPPAMDYVVSLVFYKDGFGIK